MKSAASTINEARRLLFDRRSRPKVSGREMMMRLANRPIPPEDFLNVQVIVKSYFAPYFHRTSLVNFKRGDFRSSSALSKALRSGPEPIEAANISGFRSTTRITYVRVRILFVSARKSLTCHSFITRKEDFRSSSQDAPEIPRTSICVTYPTLYVS